MCLQKILTNQEGRDQYPEEEGSACSDMLVKGLRLSKVEVADHPQGEEDEDQPHGEGEVDHPLGGEEVEVLNVKDVEIALQAKKKEN